LQKKPIAVQRRDIIANSGPSVYGITRNTKVKSPSGEAFIFLGVRDGEVWLEREDKTKGEAFISVDSSEFADWIK